MALLECFMNRVIIADIRSVIFRQSYESDLVKATMDELFSVVLIIDINI